MNYNTLLRYVLYVLCFFFISNIINGQPEKQLGVSEKLEKINFKAQIGFQIWSTYTFGQERYDETVQNYKSQPNIWNNQLRRSRLGFSAKPFDFLSIKFTISLDLVGADNNAATQGGKSNTSRQFQLWNMYLRFSPWVNSDLFDITIGYQPPQVSRESIVAALRSTSFDKSWSQNYLRKHLVGTGNGRTMGINIGGQQTLNSSYSWSYDVGIYNTPNLITEITNNDVPINPLFTGRFVIYIGDPESKKHSTSHKVNYFGQRTGLSLGYSVAYQGETPSFLNNKVWSNDFLFNYKLLSLDGEYSILSRKGNRNITSVKSRAATGFIRLGYSIQVLEKSYIEPVIMHTFFDGGITTSDIQDSYITGSQSGKDHIYDFTLNYHFNNNLKFSLSYINNNGSSDNTNSATTINNFFFDSNGQAIRRGNLVAMACVIIL